MSDTVLVNKMFELTKGIAELKIELQHYKTENERLKSEVEFLREFAQRGVDIIEKVKRKEANHDQ